jgi:hypothetical protein
MTALLCDSSIAKKRCHVQQKMITAGEFYQYRPLVDLAPKLSKIPHISLALKGMSLTATLNYARGKPISLLSCDFMVTVKEPHPNEFFPGLGGEGGRFLIQARVQSQVC